jgi:hypothetical protein
MTKRARICLWLGHMTGAAAVVSFALGVHQFQGDTSSIKVVLFILLCLFWFVAAPLGRLLINPDKRSRRISYTQWEMQVFLQSTVLSCLFICVFTWMMLSSWKAAGWELTLSDLFTKIKGL